MLQRRHNSLLYEVVAFARLAVCHSQSFQRFRNVESDVGDSIRRKLQEWLQNFRPHDFQIQRGGDRLSPMVSQTRSRVQLKGNRTVIACTVVIL